MSPLCETYLTVDQLDDMEPFYPLHVRVCSECLLVQLPAYVAPSEIFSEYAYFSSYSTAWLAHSEAYVADMVERLGLDSTSFVVELASNDGYLLQYFVEKNIPCLGVEPAANVAEAAVEKGVPTLVEFFDDGLAHRLVEDRGTADLIAANNVLAQVDDINGFVAGIRTLLSPDGVATIEVPHLERLMAGNQLDTIYHEHFSYFSLTTLERISEAHNLIIFDVEELWTHGGSLRVYLQRREATRARSDSLDEILRREESRGLLVPESYGDFGDQARATKHALVSKLIALKETGATIVGYGAPGKGNTLLNYCAIRTDILDFTVDRNPFKQGRFLPGTHIPIHDPGRIAEARPDYVMILPWNLADEVMHQLAFISEWGGRFIIPIPDVTVIDPGSPQASRPATAAVQ